MKLMMIVGNHPRHLHYLNEIIRSNPVEGVIIQERGSLLPTAPVYLRQRERALWHKHFSDRYVAEIKYFGSDLAEKANHLDIPVHKVDKHSLEGKGSVKFVQDINPDLVLIFGCGMIRGDLAKVLPDRTINLHLGISPRYRGAATLFWPFYFLEPQWAGCTFHKIVYEPDAGDILHQCVPNLDRGDGIHDVGCKAVLHATGEMRRLLYRSTDWVFKPQKGTGKNFLSSDFKADHLKVIYDVFNNKIVDKYLDGWLPGREPTLIRCV